MLYLIMCKSMTYAQRAARLLERSGITTAVIRAPQSLGKNGCAYAVTVRRRWEQAVEVLRRNQQPFGKVFRKGEDGSYTEVEV